ncbi:superoxide dismutase [Clostridium sp. P21]|uniref:superoxide dismutase n=1 Tax=Clostridium muellerianum TaxID=2716538 RepID=A0A7Y0ELR1_9CLOT|nr:superoxide dismutase [Clostridium muellerianum]NMM65786.1 superoxide dismutase [Clostridium muellerianum]
MFKLEPMNFNFSTVKGITKDQLIQHYKLYSGYVKKLNELWNFPVDVRSYGEGNSTYSNMRSLKLGETYALDGIILHQLYFENICNSLKKPYGEILNLIMRDFKSFENFKEYLTNVGLSMRGWAILVIDPIDNRLHIIGSDAHDIGALWNCYPLLVMDVYEHAYFIDFQTNRKKYIQVFIENINWKIVNERLQKYYLMKSTLNNLRCFDNNSICPRWYI